MVAMENAKVAAVFRLYPQHIQRKLLMLRQLILDTAAETEGVDAVEETLKWGEPSYLAKQGSTIRIHWKKSSPHQYAMYFNCNTRLVETFRERFGGEFNFEGNRAIVFGEQDEIPVEPLRQCITSSLMYHARKHLPLLGL